MIAYLDCSSGISGDMLLAVFIDAGMPIKRLREGLSCLHLSGYRLNAETVKRNGFRATMVDTRIHDKGQGKPAVKRWRDVEGIIKRSSLSDDLKDRGLLIFRRLFEAEAKVHGERFDDVHLHELGAIDCIIDIIGTLLAMEFFKIERVYSSPLNIGRGTVETGHGRLPVPAFATIELLKGIPVYSSDIDLELTTPTGAAIISTIAHDFGVMPEMRISRIGIGAGKTDIKGHPNVLRLFIGEGRGQEDNSVIVIETNIDDMNPQVYEYLSERLLESGALDVFLTSVIMKKGRPGIKLTVLSPDDKRDELIKVIFNETTTIGVRFYRVERRVLQREIRSLDTRFGKVRIKLSYPGDGSIRVSPEYSECIKIAKKKGISLLEVMNETTRSFIADRNKKG